MARPTKASPRKVGGKSEGKDPVTGRFLPGNHLGPGTHGRPLGSVSLRARLRQALAAEPERADRIIAKLLADAESRDPKVRENARGMIFDQVDGKPTQPLEVAGGLVLRHNPERPSNGASPPSTAERLKLALSGTNGNGTGEHGDDA